VPPEPVIAVNGLRVAYGAFEAVRGVSFQVAPGEVFGLVGPNGAGKTSTLKVLAGLMRPSAGVARIAGCDVVSARDDVRRKIGYMADFFGVYDYLTVREYLAFFGGMYGWTGAALEERIAAMLETVSLVVKRDALVRTLSRGMKQRLYLARALVHQPPVLLLDEPASGMDPRGRSEMVATLQKVAAGGTTIIISSHILDELQDLCTTVGIMEAGRLVGTRGLRDESAETADVRRVSLFTPVADRERALALLATLSCVRGTAASGDALLLNVAGGDDAVGGVVKQLVEGGVRVLLPPAGASNLKEIFLKMTRGELM